MDTQTPEEILASLEATIESKLVEAQGYDTAAEEARVNAARTYAEVNNLRDSASKIRDALAARTAPADTF